MCPTIVPTTVKEINQTNEDEVEWKIRCLDYNYHVVELMVIKWIEGLNKECSIVIDNIDDFEEAKSNHEILFIGFFNSRDDVEFKLYEDICK